MVAALEFRVLASKVNRLRHVKDVNGINVFLFSDLPAIVFESTTYMISILPILQNLLE